ncbi:MAG TPA: peptidoglycan recognition protein [Gaiellaceae bacterium]|nr:peptidoglycan recognition protein [Gaiellaceae bacterium]
MRRRLALLLLAALLAGVAAPAALGGTPAPARLVEVPHAGASTVRGGRFTLAGLHWQGPGRVLFRTRSLDGRWSAWRPAAPEGEDGPDVRAHEARRSRGWRVGNPWWTGPSDLLQTRTAGRVRRVRAVLVWSPESLVPYRAPAAVGQPAIVPRATWGADESIRRSPPSYADAVRFAVVHHTAGRNDYTRAEAAAIVKGIQLFHVRGNGWNDIGYNFLVDRFGTVYEGRFGGIDRNVVGAHARGFNTGSVGVALLGTYGGTAPSKAALDALAGLLAWRLDLAHVDPAGFLTALSGGNERYAPGLPVTLRNVSGHRDTGFTECPGDALYGRLDALARTARATGGAKIFDPLAEEVEATFRFRARLSGPLPWTVVVRDAGGVEVARGSGAGTELDWTWDPAGAAPGAYGWRIEAGGARPAAGTLRVAGGAGTLAVQELTASPAAITPNGDGQADTAELAYRLTKDANVTVAVETAEGGAVATLVDRAWTRAGERTVTLDGSGLADGSYRVLVSARRATGESAEAETTLLVSRTLGTVTVAPGAFSPNGDGRLDRLTVRFPLASPADVRVRVLREGSWVASVFAGSLGAGEQRIVWSGERASGTLRDGTLEASVEVTDAVGTFAFAVPFAVDTVAPRVRILPGRRLRVEVSEAAALVVRAGDTVLRRRVAGPAVVRLPASGARRVHAVAWDAAGNRSEPAVWIAPKGAGGRGQ